MIPWLIEVQFVSSIGQAQFLPLAAFQLRYLRLHVIKM